MPIHSPLCCHQVPASAWSWPPSAASAIRATLRRPLARGLCLGLATLLGGCASSFQWVKEGFSPPHAEAKLASCPLEAERRSYFSAESEEDRTDRVEHEAQLCMKADGWQWVAADGEGASDRPSSALLTRHHSATAATASVAVTVSTSSGGKSADNTADQDKADDKADDKAGDKAGDKTSDKKDDEDDDDDE